MTDADRSARLAAILRRLGTDDALYVLAQVEALTAELQEAQVGALTAEVERLRADAERLEEALRFAGECAMRILHADNADEVFSEAQRILTTSVQSYAARTEGGKEDGA